MCDHCDSFTRRDLLKLAGLSAALAFTGCDTNPGITDLPEVYSDHLTQTRGDAESGPVHIDPKKIVVPPPQPAQHSDYGDIMPRSAWTNTPLQLSNANLLNGVNRITLHHTGDGKPFMGESTEDVARHLQIVQQAHLQRGMIDIAYHFAVDRTGRVWQLRWLQYEGQHVRIGKNGVRNNEHNIGVVTLGDFTLQSPTIVQRDRLFTLVRLLRKEYSPPGSLFGYLPVSMHGELVDTTCPGPHLASQIRAARTNGII